MRNGPTAQRLCWAPSGAGGYPQMTLNFASLCSLLSHRACLSAGLRPLSPPSPEWRTGTLGCFEDSVLKILFRKHRGNFSSPFPFPGIVDPMKKLTTLLLVTKWLADMSPLAAGGYRVLPPGAPEVGADLLTLRWQPSVRAPGPCWQGLKDLHPGPGTSPYPHPCPVVL